MLRNSVPPPPAFLFFKKRPISLFDKGSVSAGMTDENIGILPNFEADF
jgi:hypothetical protein